MNGHQSRSGRSLVLRALVLSIGLLNGLPLVAQERPTEVRLYDVVVRRSDAKEFEGEIVEETDLRVILLNRQNIKMQFSKDEVLRIDRRVTPMEAYRNRHRAATFDAGRFADQLALGRWAAQYPDELREQALQHLVQATTLDPTQAEPYALLMPLFDRKSLGERTPEEIDVELGACRRALGGAQASVRVVRRAADLLERLGDPDGAIHVLEQLDQLGDAVRSAEPAEAQEVENRLARLLAGSGRRADARALVDRILPSRSAAEARELLLLRARWLLEDCAAGEEGACEQFLEGINALIAQDGSGEAYLLRGSYYLLRAELEAAAADLAQAASRGVFDARAMLTYALSFARSGEFSKAREALLQVRNAGSVAAQAKLVEAYLLENEGATKEALSLLEEAVRDPAASWQAWIQYLQTRQRAQPGESSAERLQPLLRAHQDNAVAFSEAALLQADQALREQDGSSARRWLDYAGMGIGEDAEFYLRLGHAHLFPGGDPRRARAALNRALELKPDALDVQNALGTLEYREGNLTRASALFEGVVKAFPEDARKAAEPTLTLAYALRALGQADRALNEELWGDAFDRQAGEKVLNNWTEQETFGIEIGICDGGGASLKGTQKFEPGGLTVLSRDVPAERLSRVRIVVSLREGGQAATLALRVEDPQGQSGLIYFRHPDGDMAFALNRGERASEEVRCPADAVEGTPEETAERDPRKLFDMRARPWPVGPQVHVMEIRFGEDGETGAALYFDDERVARRIESNFMSRRGSVRVGVSVMAPLGTQLEVEVPRVEVYRRKVAVGTGRRF